MLVWNEISWRGQTCFVFNCWRFHLKTFDYDRLLKCSIGKSFGWVRLPNPIEVNRTIGVRLSSITERSIDYGGRMKFQLNSEITPGIHNAHVNFTFCWSSRNTGNLYICQLTKGFKSNSPIIKQSTHSTTLVDKVSLTWSSSVNKPLFILLETLTSITRMYCSDHFLRFLFTGSSNYMLKLKYFYLKEPSERPETHASNRDSDDDERDCDSNKLKGHSENPRQMQQETNEDMSKEPSTSR